MKLNGGSFMPLYQQLIESIKSDIDDGKYQYEQKIPSESDLSRNYSISRITIRRAVDELCNEGYLVKRQGMGTFVNKPKLLRKIIKPDDVQSFSEVCRVNGMVAGARVIEWQITKAQLDEQKFFSMDKDGDLLYIQRVRTADEQPIMLENNFFPYTRFKDLENEPLNKGSLFALLQDKFDTNICDTTRTSLEIVRAKTIHAKLLKVAIGEPLFYMNAYFIDEKGMPTCIGRQFIVGSKFTFNI
jgi:GntR family transcriptional regulator